MPYVGQKILIGEDVVQTAMGQKDILRAVREYCPQEIINAGPFELVAAEVKKVIERDPEVWDPDAEDMMEVELQTKKGKRIWLPDRLRVAMLTQESEGVVWFGTPAGAPHLELAMLTQESESVFWFGTPAEKARLKEKEAGPPPPLQTWEARYEAATDSCVKDIQVQTYTEWDARLAVAEALSKQPEVTGLDTPWAPGVPKTPYLWMSYAHSTFSASATELLEPGKVTYREEKILAWDELE